MAELMTLEEVANYLRVNEKTIYRLLDKHGIPATRVGHLWRFDKASIDSWIHQRSIPAALALILVIDDDATVGSLFQEALSLFDKGRILEHMLFGEGGRRKCDSLRSVCALGKRGRNRDYLNPSNYNKK